ncbi:EH domain-binding protein 1, partial [Anabarilius grahami]
QPDKLVVVWTRRSRRKSSKSHSWQPGIKNPYRGVVVWPVPENIEITVTLFKDPHAEEFEDKEWTFVIENEHITWATGPHAALWSRTSLETTQNNSATQPGMLSKAGVENEIEKFMCVSPGINLN